ncbi:MAG: DNA polymerase III subunit gamma/tau [Acidobacteria bacterium]|nr:DNA polymerase III subunit gamma/tau [Acidobacteriota bacterium]MBV9475799.1 DNA polymerase III subunit gamma/tau [Acidobacteriota bacterium]
MSYQALARKYRPQTFQDIVGQETAVRTLRNAIEDERIHHAYLFSGVRGVGKTTLARILAKALNCEHGPTRDPDNTCTICREITEGIDLDVREIDAATYTGVDNVRELRDVSQFQPARDHYRIFIIDEAHMLSTASWNALLKLIEEPPPHVVFMFATTEMQKVPTTIISRTQKILLRKINLDDLIKRLADVCRMEGIEATRPALEIIARRGEGSVRDSLSLLDQIIAFSGRSIDVEDVATVLGLSDTNFFARVITEIADGDHAAILEALQEAADTGRDFKMLYRDLLNFVRNLMLIAGGANESMLSVQPEDLPTLQKVAEKFSYSDLLRIANLLLRDDETVNRAEHQRLAVEIALLKAATFPRLKAVEQVLASDTSTATASPAAPRVRAVEKPAQRPAAAANTTTSAASVDTGSADAFLERAKKARPLLGGYLTGAKHAAKEGNRITLTFDDPHLAEPLADERAALEKIAAEVYGAPTQVIIETHNDEKPGGRRAEDKPSPLRDDPVLSSFRKHLGGELLKESKR